MYKEIPENGIKWISSNNIYSKIQIQSKCFEKKEEKKKKKESIITPSNYLLVN